MKPKTVKLMHEDFFESSGISDYSNNLNEHLNMLKLENLYNNNKLLIINEEDEIKLLASPKKKDSSENNINKLMNIQGKSIVIKF